MPLLTVKGRFYRAIRADRADAVLDAPGPESAGRYHRPGERALYVTPEADWAIIAVGGYMAEDGAPRVIIPVDIGPARVLDQRDATACAMLGIDRDASNRPWRDALSAGEEPPSWRNADAARAICADGIVDRSRGIAGGWHVTLFRWNMPGAPDVVVAGEALTVPFSDARARWSRTAGA